MELEPKRSDKNDRKEPLCPVLYQRAHFFNVPLLVQGPVVTLVTVSVNFPESQA